MEGDYSWTHSAGEYMKIYQDLFAEKKLEEPPRVPEKNPVVMEDL